ncbi:coiled-coil domain-containing protein [Reichenbachiella versicolor]|uniref:coiled-coil domain-containing protein n=1 Tax=Reichenbachiella versicolor TaxID=1821036 RepID=UPI000D6E4DC0|nr:hypothetical protein [Reichenbachiella versicolor]
MKRQYSFNTIKDADFYDELVKQTEVFTERIEIISEDDNWAELDILKKDRELIRSFTHETIMNIIWYKNKIRKENVYRVFYNVLTILLILAVPFVIYYTTDHVHKNDWDMGEKITSIVTVILTFIFAIHKWLTAWIEKRNFISSFNNAKIELQNILFRIENDYRGVALDPSGKALTTAFRTALHSGISNARLVLQEETKSYFAKLSNPGFDLSGSLISSSSSAKKMFSQLKSERFKVEDWRTEFKDNEDKKAKKEEEQKSNVFDLRKEILASQYKYQEIQNRIIDLGAKEADLYDDLEQMTNKDPKLEKQLERIQNQLEKLESSSDQLTIEMKVKEAELDILMKKEVL